LDRRAVSITPTIREFLIRLDELLDRIEPPGLERDAITIAPAETSALVRLPHRTNHERDIELEIDDRRVVVAYLPERIPFTSQAEALQFVEMVCQGRVELEVSRGPLWTTMRSYRDGQRIPFRRTRMPWPAFPPRTERRRVGFAD
jgi:hypothetical protein